jgi:hypothetical protein
MNNDEGWRTCVVHTQSAIDAIDNKNCIFTTQSKPPRQCWHIFFFLVREIFHLAFFKIFSASLMTVKLKRRPGLPDGLFSSPKSPNLGKFWRALDRKNGYILWPFEIFYGHSGQFMTIWYIFSGFWYHGQRIIWQPRRRRPLKPKLHFLNSFSRFFPREGLETLKD